MKIKSDFHSHVSHSSAHQVVEAAREKGLRVLGLSEHIFQMGEARPMLEHLRLEGPLLTFPGYIEAVHAAAQLPGIDVRLGMEVDFIPAKNDVTQGYLQGFPWDFLIGSVHEIDGVQFESEKKWDRAEGEKSWMRYFELLRLAVSSGYFSLVSHPVRMRRKNPYLPPLLDEELERLAAEAARCDVALEINGYDVLSYPGLVRRLARACALNATPVSVGSDAHYPGEIAQAHPQSEAILQEVGITKVRIWKNRVAEEYQL